MLAATHKMIVEKYKKLGMVLPKNRDLYHDRYQNLILRELDCLVIEFMHENILKDVQSEIKANGYSNTDIFDSTRGAFIEGGPIYEGAGIYEKHISRYVSATSIA